MKRFITLSLSLKFRKKSSDGITNLTCNIFGTSVLCLDGIIHLTLHFPPALQRSCESISNLKNKRYYMIDPDFKGPAKAFWVSALFW